MIVLKTTMKDMLDSNHLDVSGRTDNAVKNHWHSSLKFKANQNSLHCQGVFTNSDLTVTLSLLFFFLHCYQLQKENEDDEAMNLRLHQQNDNIEPSVTSAIVGAATQAETRRPTIAYIPASQGVLESAQSRFTQPGITIHLYTVLIQLWKLIFTCVCVMI